MKVFDISDRKLKIHQHYLLEASAGTGKTFCIEHLVVRLLLEPEPNEHFLPSLDNILVVTFTRAAVSELKERIRSTITKSLFYLQNTELCLTEAPDYLKQHLEMGVKAIAVAKWRLEQALSCFDEAAIFTIHGFCQRMLTQYSFDAQLGKDASGIMGLLSDAHLIQIVRDFFRTELKPEWFSPGQVQIVLGKHKQDIQNLERALCRLIAQGVTIVPSPSFLDTFETFKGVIKTWNERFEAQTVYEDLLKIAPYFVGTCNKKGELKSEFLMSLKTLLMCFNDEQLNLDDFDKIVVDGLEAVRLLSPSNQKAKASLPIPYPEILYLMAKDLLPIVQKAGNYLTIFARMGTKCQELLDRYAYEEERFRHDDLVKAMWSAAQNDVFAEALRKQFPIAIIDEFQDTDATQWHLFQKVFLSKRTRLYLVGDPKQSIYGFRNADIYTYMAAADALGHDQMASLDTNYRSQPELVYALNRLFSTIGGKRLFPLPRSDCFLDFYEAKASLKVKPLSLSDGKGSVHFCFAEGKQGKSDVWPSEELEQNLFFPFIAHEMIHLKEKEKIQFGRWAILVSDRFQADRLVVHLRKCNIPCLIQRQASLSDSPSLFALKEFLKAVRHPEDLNACKQALGGKLIGWDHSVIRDVSEIEFAQACSKFYFMRKRLMSSNFAQFFFEFLQSYWNHPLPVGERLLSQEGHVDFYHELLQVAELVIKFQNETHASIESIQHFLDDLSDSSDSEEELMKVRQDDRQDAVKVLTIHTSKGLEFDFVFALGLATRKKRREELIPIEQEGKRKLAALEENHPLSQLYYREIDAEKMRQLYVAMTRAKYRLYLPFCLMSNRPRKIEWGEPSPMELFIARLHPSNDFLDRISCEDGTALRSFLESFESETSITYSILKEPSISLYAANTPIPPLKALKQVKIPGDAYFVHSFSSLSLAGKQNEKETSLTPPHDFEEVVKNVHTLPSGNETGNIVHRILEKIPLLEVRYKRTKEELIPLIQPYLKGTPFTQWENVFAELVLYAFQVPLKIGETVFRLCDLDPHQIYREMEFLFPCDPSLYPVIPELKFSKNYLKGVIDAIFEMEGKYYIVDWKSNWLGKSTEDYHDQALEVAVKAHSYDLQANIYTEALKRYLRTVDSRPFELSFGGTIYLFLRGLSFEQQTGIFFFKPNQCSPSSMDALHCLEQIT